MISRAITTEIDVTPPNWGTAPSYYEDKALRVYAWVAEQTRPLRPGNAPDGFHIGELQAVTVSITAPHVVFRMIVPDRFTAAEVVDFADRTRAALGDAVKGPDAESRRAA